MFNIKRNSELLGKYEWYVSIQGIQNIKKVEIEFYSGDTIILLKELKHIRLFISGELSNIQIKEGVYTSFLDLLNDLQSLQILKYKLVKIESISGKFYTYKYKYNELKSKNSSINYANWAMFLNEIKYLEVILSTGMKGCSYNQSGRWMGKWGSLIDINTLISVKNISKVYCVDNKGKKHLFKY